MKIAVFGQDPGGTTGVAWGMFDLDLPDHGMVMRNREYSDQRQITGDERHQIRSITRYWSRFFKGVVRYGVHHKRVYFVCEDFTLRADTGAGKEYTSPERIMWGVEGYRMGMADAWHGSLRGQQRQVIMPEMIMQQPSQAATYGTKDRLNQWDCWIVGKEHCRSAWSHIGLFVKEAHIGYQQSLSKTA